MTTVPKQALAIEGWMTPGELTWLCDQAQTMGSVVEIGSYCGRSSYALLSVCDGPVYCVDPWASDYQWSPKPESRFADFCANVGHFKNLHVIRGRSPDVAGLVGDVDMVFIDGDHSYEGVMADLAAWTPKARRLICGHDYHNGEFPGVTHAVREVFGQRLANPHHSLWAVDAEPVL